MGYDKAAAVKPYQQHETDFGSTRVQIAMLSARINSLTGHFRSHATLRQIGEGIRAAPNAGRASISPTLIRVAQEVGYLSCIPGPRTAQPTH